MNEMAILLSKSEAGVLNGSIEHCIVLVHDHGYLATATNAAGQLAELSALRSRIAELEALTTWQPIGTAPERVDILILVQTRVGVQVEQVEMVDCHYFRLYGVSAEYHNPTHWMPLPKPPEEK